MFGCFDSAISKYFNSFLNTLTNIMHKRLIKLMFILSVVSIAITLLFTVWFLSPFEHIFKEDVEDPENSTTLFCTDQFIMDVNEQRNENAQVLEECKEDERRLTSSITENIKYISNYAFKVSKVLLQQLKLDSKGIKDLSTPRNKSTRMPTFVTGLSDNHFEESKGFFRMVNQLRKNQYPELKLVVFNLGLSQKNIIEVAKYCNCSIRNFPFEIYPTHVRHLRGFTWKPIIIQTVLQESDFVLWMDTSIRLNNTDPYFIKAKRYGIQVLTGHGSISVRTHRQLFDTLKENPCMFNYPELQAGLVLITRSCLTLTYIMRPWVSCALQFRCMDIPNAEKYYDCSNEKNISSCHRSDQSVLGILLTRLFNNRRHQLVLGRDFANVCRNCN